MIPEFPRFKTLELSDKEEVEKITAKYPPYSDFNFVSMWCWDIKGEMRISLLNNNLVVKFTDYLTGNPFFSFLGDNMVNETAETLLKCSIEDELKPKLFLVSENIISKLDGNKFRVDEDIDNFDYIFDLKEVSEYSGSQFIKKRNKVKQLLKSFPNIKVLPINIQDKDIEEKILKLDELWANNKIQEDISFRTRNEFLATKRFFESKIHFDDIFSLGVFLDDELIGYSIFSILGNDYALSHFAKADIKFVGIYDFLIRECAKMLREQQCSFLNYEQDLGLPGLRVSKKSFMSKYLKKFAVGFI